jgi:hypothetical protein
VSQGSKIKFLFAATGFDSIDKVVEDCRHENAQQTADDHVFPCVSRYFIWDGNERGIRAGKNLRPWQAFFPW